MITKEDLEKFVRLNENITEIKEIFKIEKRSEEIIELEKEMSKENFWDDKNKAKNIVQLVDEHKEIINSYKNLEKFFNDTKVILELLAEAEDENLEKEFLENLEKLENKIKELEFINLLDDELDKNNAILNIHPGAGGTESCDWASMLFRMYKRWCERNKFNIDILDYQAGDEAGIKNITILVKGKFAFGYLKCESGIHRLVRISPFDANSRRHTSFASVHAMPEINEDIEIEINDKDLKIDTYRASGAGGQYVNKTDSAVRITHIPTGIVVSCQNERSQHQNRENAMKILKAKLYELKKEEMEREKEKLSGEKKDIGWGNQIRSYIFCPYTLVKDHRTKFEKGDIQSVMDGDINEFIFAYLKFLKKNK
ncbi:MAG TPA: peptide chain release factor 2 [bacterium]|nr:peptide chain release factor 2 [bacterium]HOL47355.1 peptide chain release factor 2 [bacterium]HPQ18912.1 peptide chain release factor 2 [bacterium]